MKKIIKILAKYSDESDLIDVLEEIQAEYGYLSEENLKLVEQKLGIPLVQISGVTTFYAGFKLKAQGKHSIKICRGTACHVKRSDVLKSYLEEKLDVDEGETTDDGLFTLDGVNCIGACAKAPAMMVDNEVYGNLTKDRIDEILEKYK